MAKRSVQPPSIPGAGAQMHRTIRAAAIAILTPILERECRDVKRGPAQVAKVRDGAGCLCVRQILQDVIANHQIERPARRIVDDRTSLPVETAAQVLARFKAYIARPRQKFLEGPAQQADAAARIEYVPNGNLALPQGTGDGGGAAVHFRRGDHPCRGVQIEFSEIGSTKIVGGRLSVYLTSSFLTALYRGFTHA
jgi:hypothetical protein